MTKASEPLAKMVLRQGRLWLVVAGLHVAMEGDKLRDPNIIENPGMPGAWSKEGIQQVVEIINKEVNRL